MNRGENSFYIFILHTLFIRVNQVLTLSSENRQVEDFRKRVNAVIGIR
jgi:hypothetical protein